MTATAAIRKTYTLDEYFSLEEQSAVKHEFDHGKLIEMAGGTFDHNHICAHVMAALIAGLAQMNRYYRTYNSDMKVYLPMLQKVVYPDVSIILEAPEPFESRRDVLMNPLLIVEVLSDSTAAYDRGKKFEGYCSIPSFREYILVSQSEPFLEAFYLHDPETNLWKISRASGLDSKLFLHSIGVEIALQDVYRGITFEEVADRVPESLKVTG